MVGEYFSISGGLTVANHVKDRAKDIRGGERVVNELSPYTDYILCKGDSVSLGKEVSSNTSSGLGCDIEEEVADFTEVLAALLPMAEPLTWQEAINGKENDSSVGLPYLNRHKDFGDFLESYPPLLLENILQEVEQSVLDGADPVCVCYVFSKRDKYTPQKCQGSRFRSIQCCDVLLLLIMRRWFYGMAHEFYVRMPQSYLVTTQSQYVAKTGPLRSGWSFGVDFSAYDKSESLALNLRVFRALCTRTMIPCRLRTWIERNVFSPTYLTAGGDLYLPGGGNPSGQYLTSVLNTANHMVMNARCYKQLLGVRPLDYYMNRTKVRSIMTGDDGIESFEDKEDADLCVKELPSLLSDLFCIGAKVDLPVDGSPYPPGVLPPYLSEVEVFRRGYCVKVPVRPHRVICGLQYQPFCSPSITDVDRQKVESAIQSLAGFLVLKSLDKTYPMPACVASLVSLADRVGVEVPPLLNLLYFSVVDVSFQPRVYETFPTADGIPRCGDTEQHCFQGSKFIVLMPRNKKRTNTVARSSGAAQTQQGRRRQRRLQQAKESEKTESMPMIPAPRVPSRIANAILKEGMSRSDTPLAAKWATGLSTAYDRFQLGLLHSLFEPARPFPAPGIRRSGVQGPTTSDFQASGNTWGTSAITAGFAEIRGTTYHWGSNEESVVIGRYVRFNGKAVHTVEYTTNASGEAEFWFLHDPTDMTKPILVLDIKDSVAGNYTDITVLDALPYTANPYALQQIRVQELGDNPVEEVDTLSLYYEGSSALTVTTLNQNAFLSTAYQTRTGDNTVDWMYQRTYPWAPPRPSDNLGWTDSPQTAGGALSLYTAETWHLGTRMIDGTTGDSLKFWASHLVQRCWQLGAPFIRVVVRTQSNGSPAPGPVQFNVVLNNWVCSAPMGPAAAGGMPLETVPFASPSWLRVVKTRGAVSVDGKMEKAFQDAVRSSLARVPSNVAGTSQVERALAVAPAEVLTRAAVTPVSEVPAKSTWVDWAEKAINHAPSILSGLKKAVEVGASLLAGGPAGLAASLMRLL